MRHYHRRLLIASLLGLVLCLLAGAPSIQAAPRLLSASQAESLESQRVIGGEVIEELQRVPTARVMIAFAVSAPKDSEGLSAERHRLAIEAAGERLLSQVAVEDLSLAHRFRSINALAGTVTANGLLALAKVPGLLRIDLDTGGEAHMDESMTLIGLDKLQNQGLTGAGVTVAVLDSGLDSDHADLLDDLAAERCFCSGGGAGCCPDGTANQEGPGSAEDDNGHGTNVAGVLSSAGILAPTGGAPNVDLVAIKVLDSNNSFCCSSDVIAGLDWILTERPDVDLVNLSLGTSALYAGHCDAANAITQAYATAIEALRERGTLTFASSGNQASANAMSAPACIASAVSVAAVYDDNIGSSSFSACTDPTTAADQITCFSNTSSTTDLLAPGAAMTSTGMGGGTSTYYGTSQAAPAAAACAALLLGVHPNITPDLMEDALKASSTLITDPDNGLAYPRVDCVEAREYAEIVLKNPFEVSEVTRSPQERQ